MKVFWIQDWILCRNFYFVYLYFAFSTGHTTTVQPIKSSKLYFDPYKDTIGTIDVSLEDGEVPWEVNTLILPRPVFMEPSAIRNEYTQLSQKVIESVSMNAISSGIEGGFYQETFKIDTILNQLNNILYENIVGKTTNAEVLIIVVSLLLGVNYNRYRLKTIKYEKRLDDMTPYLHDYKRTRKLSYLLFIALLSIFTKNIENAI